MPRKSSAALSVLPTTGTAPRIDPPRNLTPAAAKAFRALVASVDAGHFTPADVPLLAEYARAVELADQAAQGLQDGPVVDGRVSPWVTVQEKASRSLVALSARLRVCPQSRFDRLVAGRTARRGQATGIDALGIGE